MTSEPLSVNDSTLSEQIINISDEDETGNDDNIKKLRVISREELYQDPNADNQEVIRVLLPNVPKVPRVPKVPKVSSNPQFPAGYDWTKRKWFRGGLLDEESPNDGGFQNNARTLSLGTVVRLLQRNLDKSLSKPVEMSKAESMMQKMGWNGGGLGKAGQGIVEPIVPNDIYANKNIGFGQNCTMPSKKRNRKPPYKVAPKPIPRKVSHKSTLHLKTNVLNLVLEFVKNDREMEILFDKKFYPKERKIIHIMIHDVINGEDETQRSKFEFHVELLNEIYAHNCYILDTESEGIHPDRQLRLFKEAPPNVYLITPEDISKPKKELQQTEPTNTDIFYKELKIVIKEIQDMFIEFSNQTEYDQFRFLGPFCVLQMSCISVFFNTVNQCVNKNFEGLDDVIVNVFKSDVVFQLREDVNGSAFIQKCVKKEDETV